VRLFFRFLNRFFMVPMFRLGLGPFFGNPISGYVMVLRTIGRKTGRVRYVPVSYAIANGSIYVLVGYGRTSPWFLNLQANPDVDVILPGGAIAGHVQEATDPAERALVLRRVLKNAGFGTLFEGLNPYRASDEALAARTADQPLLRIKPTGLGNGASDPGGWAWLWTVAAPILLVALVVALVH
jgi:deazaflavin-dependent oxidoreductase (nitroreductase family)